MQTKQKFNLMLPVTLMREFERAAEPYGAKRKWLAVAAAMSMFIQAGPRLQAAYVQEVGAADLGDGFNDLVRRAKSGDLAGAAERRAAAAPRATVGRAPAGKKVAHVSTGSRQGRRTGRRR